MLTKSESAVMEYIYAKCLHGKCLITEQEILIGVSHKTKLSQSKLNIILKDLSLDGYFDMVLSFRKNEPVTLFSLCKKGYAFKREIIQSKRQIKSKIALAVFGGILSFIVGKILYFIFT